MFEPYACHESSRAFPSLVTDAEGAPLLYGEVVDRLNALTADNQRLCDLLEGLHLGPSEQSVNLVEALRALTSDDPSVSNAYDTTGFTLLVLRRCIATERELRQWRQTAAESLSEQQIEQDQAAKAIAELTAERDQLRVDMVACQDVCRSLAERCHGQSEALSRAAERVSPVLATIRDMTGDPAIIRIINEALGNSGIL